MASFRKRGDKWTAIVSVKGERMYQTFPSKREAKAWANEEETRLRKGGSTSREKLSWLIEQYKEAAEVEIYQSNVLDWWDKRLGGTKVHELRKADFLEARRALSKLKSEKGGTLAPATVNRRMAAISAVLTYGIEELHLLETNPAQIKALTENNARDRLLTDDERDRLLAACKAHPEPCLYALVRTAMVTGARAGELQALRWSDVDLENGVARITKNTRRDTTKNNESRPVPLAGEALELLKQRSEKGRIDNDLVFYNSTTGGVYHYRQHWAKVKKEAGIEDFRFHDLRHQAASELAMAGVPLMQIGALLGHKSAQMTKRYSHYSQESIQGLGAVLAGRTG